jgi:hypothetical protein
MADRSVSAVSYVAEPCAFLKTIFHVDIKSSPGLSTRFLVDRDAYHRFQSVHYTQFSANAPDLEPDAQNFVVLSVSSILKIHATEFSSVQYGMSDRIEAGRMSSVERERGPVF